MNNVSRILRLLGASALVAVCTVASAQDPGLAVEVSGCRTAEQVGQRVDASARAFARNLAKLTEAARAARAKAGLYDEAIPFSMPTVARLRYQGRAPVYGPARPTFLGRGPSPITLVFDNTGTRVFPTAYRDLLASVLSSAAPTIGIVFGNPSVGGVVHVRNYDADIGDRDAVAGGVFLPDNGFGEAEIRFPVYTNSEAAAVNFLHTLLLAYLGPSAYGFDAFQEGLVRASAMRIARTPGAMPAGLSSAQIDQVLENTYDVGTFYDWYNQRALGGPRFIAPNLFDVPLPAGGSLGGIYLLRYQMAGSAWQKALVEYPAFAASFNQAFYAMPGLASDVPGLVALGQQVIDSFGGAGSTLEGLPFAEWFRRQHILETKLTYGPKLLVQPVPIATGLGGNDFGVFDVQATYFDTDSNANETLLSGVSFPIFWESDFNRVFPSAQEDRMDIAGAFGSVAPNFPDLNAGAPYRVAIDLPVQDLIARAYVPAGAVATASNPTPNDFYGTVVGLGLATGDTGRVRLSFGATTIDTIPIQNGAFGTRIATGAYLGNQRLLVEVVRTRGGLDTVVLSRRVNKGPGPLALDLRVEGDGSYALPGGLPKGMSLVGIAIDPYSSDLATVLGVPENQILAGRYNQAHASYDLFPTLGPFRQGHSFFVRLPAAQPGFTLQGRTSPGTPIAVALRPGWNMIADPLLETVPTSRVRVVRAADFPRTYGEAAGVEIGTDFFTFQPGPPDAASGAPETGTLVAATQFEPGKGYFVRVLAAEGATLLFTPQTPLGPGSPGRTASANPIPHPETWSMKLTFDDRLQRASVILGQRQGASRGVDWREDGAIPPGIGGFQAWVDGGSRLYRDVRPVEPTVYRVQLEGLRVRKVIRLSFEMLEGDLREFDVYDPVLRRWKELEPDGGFQFTPQQSQSWIDVRITRRGIR
ncbi:MAG: hypothetical protein M9921_05605 [Fimbriimonadaceae bacterium]|nr:hypothetical protein [Fimbriimonadaceae bacterium]